MFAGEVAGDRARRIDVFAPVDGARRLVELRVGCCRELRDDQEHAAGDARFQAGAIGHSSGPVNSTPSARSRTSAAPKLRSSAASKSPNPRGLDATKRCVAAVRSTSPRCATWARAKAAVCRSRSRRVNMRYASMSKASARAPRIFAPSCRDRVGIVTVERGEVLPAVDEVVLQCAHRPLRAAASGPSCGQALSLSGRRPSLDPRHVQCRGLLADTRALAAAHLAIRNTNPARSPGLTT